MQCNDITSFGHRDVVTLEEVIGEGEYFPVEASYTGGICFLIGGRTCGIDQVVSDFADLGRKTSDDLDLGSDDHLRCGVGNDYGTVLATYKQQATNDREEDFAQGCFLYHVVQILRLKV